MINGANLIDLTIDEATDYEERKGYELHVVQKNAPYLVSGTKIIIVEERDGKVSNVRSICG